MSLDGSAGIAIVGMAARFPGARDVAGYWLNLAAGRRSLTRLQPAQLAAAGVSPEEFTNPRYVPVRGVIEDVEMFDAKAFGISDREAQIMDPQHRLALEYAVTALEDAGYDPARTDAAIGVFAGSSVNSYLANNVLPDTELCRSMGALSIVLGNEKDHLATRIAYRLGLRGPAVTVQTACSTSLVAIHLACQSIRSGECDMAIAGGVCVAVPQHTGHLFSEQGILSPDGRCRAFDRRAQGTVAGNGVGLVVLKSATRAIDDGDTIHAVIRGSAMNNDGAAKVGYTAPSVDGQAAVIRRAHSIAGVSASDVDYVETHGTGTEAGDAIEVTALVDAFRGGPRRTRPCLLGSVKPNVGHLDVAAGVAGLIKVVLALSNEQLPPSIDCDEPNPEIPFDDGPFLVNTKLTKWPRGARPRLAGVSSFGMGGTNVHMVVQEAPDSPRATAPRALAAPILLPISAHTPQALEDTTNRVSRHLARRPTPYPADVGFTLVAGRGRHKVRRGLVWHPETGAVTAGAPRTAARRVSVGMLFPGQGSQYPGMAAALYRSFERFRDTVDECLSDLEPQLADPLRAVLLSSSSEHDVDETWLTQPALFVTGYATARLLAGWGIRPALMLGHSIGEYVAVCLGGGLSRRDALRLVAARGRLMHQTPRGGMLAVLADETALRAHRADGMDLAAVNSPRSHVLAGPMEAVAETERMLADTGVRCRQLPVTRAFHSALMDPILDGFHAAAADVDHRPLTLPVVSNVTGEVMPAGTVLEPDYWVRQLRHTVRFQDGVRHMAGLRNPVLIEAGPGHTLARLTRQNDSDVPVLTTLPSRGESDTVDAATVFLLAVGGAWSGGVELVWPVMPDARRIPLPTYAFERVRHWLDSPHQPPVESTSASTGDASAAPDSTVDKQVREQVADVWRALVGGDWPSDATNFFEAGGDSLVAIQMLTKLRVSLGIQLDTEAFIESPTYGDLVSAVLAATPATPRGERETVQ